MAFTPFFAGGGGPDTIGGICPLLSKIVFGGLIGSRGYQTSGLRVFEWKASGSGFGKHIQSHPWACDLKKTGSRSVWGM